MARYTGPKCKICRREGTKLFLKGTRCYTAKCPVEKGSRPPGMHGFSRGRPSPYQIRLRETQKVKRFYGVLEAQFRRFFAEANREQGNTGENLLSLLERRLDNLVTITGFAVSRAQGRQMVEHGNFEVNGRKVDVASYVVEEGDVIRPKPKDAVLDIARHNRETMGHPEPGWLNVNDQDLTVTVARLPVRDDVSLVVDEGLVVEFCSR